MPWLKTNDLDSCNQDKKHFPISFHYFQEDTLMSLLNLELGQKTKINIHFSLQI